ncbi:helix-turn-helix domain-containing protein [Paenibacillus sp. 1A_MP2]|uniref:helix-turn-helix domain-containing protein n=1 Tax=Paenibacillus sp. 1A_MP2 TaxID=3457495 RepID=UPI003FCD86B6
MILESATITALLVEHIEKKNQVLSHFAAAAGINSGTLHKILHGLQPISVKILDQITHALGLEEGYFYIEYANDLIGSAPNWRRIRPFIYRCVDLDQFACLKRVVGLLMENVSYSNSLFGIAEELHQQKKKQAAYIIFSAVAESEKYQHAERLALCQYRIFINSLGIDQEKNYEYATLFEPYLYRLHESEQLDALKDLANLYYSLRRWDRAMVLATQMLEVAKNMYYYKHKKNKRSKKRTYPSKPLFGYMLYAYLLLGGIHEEKRDYKTALEYLALYENQEWVVENDDEANRTKEQFREWAKANKYLYRLMSGDTSILDEYVDYISNNENEVLRALFKIVEAARFYTLNIDHVLERFRPYIMGHLQKGGTFGSYSEQIASEGFANFLADVGAYYIDNHLIEAGIIYILESLAIAAKIKNDACVVRCVSTVEKMRHKMGAQELRKYSTIMMEVYEENEKEKIGVYSHT